MQLVLSDGKIITISRNSYPDLYWALRGAGTNLGIITSFEFETFEQGQMWGGVKVVPSLPDSGLMKQLDSFCKNNTDVDAEMFIILAYVAEHDAYMSTIVSTYSKPEIDPPAFDSFKDLPAVFSSMRITSLTDLTVELDAANPSGLRSVTP